jgi:filamentous hemagglutinin family protein
MSKSLSMSDQIRLFVIFFFSVLSIPLAIAAQVVPDKTLPNNSAVKTEGNTNIIEGGTSSGNNLFHSFDSFSVPTGGTAYFNNLQEVQSIFSRVTGSSISNIDGLIKANGSANLFLLNPNGILFGSNASLDLGGSFLATTADTIKFADGLEFSVQNPQVNPALTVSVPVGLGFASNPGAITVQGEGNNLSNDPQTFELIRDNRPVGLQVQQNQTLALVGGELNLQGGNLTSEQGRIELGSVGEGESVKLIQANSGWKLSYEGVQNFRDVRLSQTASVDTSGDGGGDIQVQGRQVFLTDGSALLANTLGSSSGGTLTVKASEMFEAGGISANNAFVSLVSTIVESGGTGNGGNLTINTKHLKIADGALIVSTTFSLGNAGNVNISAKEIEAIGASPIAPTTISASAQAGTGNGGNLTIDTERLKVADGAQIGSSTFDAGDAGTLDVKAREIELVGVSRFDAERSSGLFASVEPGSTGNGGSLTINTERLQINDHAKIATESEGTGQAGNFIISADQLEINRGSITATSDQSGGGNINLKTSQLFLRNNSSINTSVFDGTGGGGNLTIDTNALVTLNNSDLTAKAFQGVGGRITISAEGVFRSLDSDIDASSQLGIDGEVNINSITTDFQNSMNPISPKFIVTEQAIAGSCLARRNEQQGSFVYAGKGGLPENPSSAIDEEESLSVRLPKPKPSSPTSGASEANSEEVSPSAETVIYPAQTARKWQIGDPIIEPTNLIKTADGRLLWVRKGVDDVSSQICQ